VKLEIRQALDQDTELCFSITEESMREYVEATWGVWEESSQRNTHAESFSPATHWIVLASGKEVGVVAAANESSHVQLVKLYLRSRARSQGIGSIVLRSILRFGAKHGQASEASSVIGQPACAVVLSTARLSRSVQNG